METMAVPVMGVSCAGAAFMQQHIDIIMHGAGCRWILYSRTAYAVYVHGGQMGFVANVADGYLGVAFIAAKRVCALLSMLIACKIYGRTKTR